TLERIPNNSHVILDGERVFIDEDIIELVEDFVCSCERRNIEVTLSKSNLAVNRLFKENLYGNN
ncbi:MAG: hypothetical protein WDA09_10475, partial [Bacteriovoracaceae bacterium]